MLVVTFSQLFLIGSISYLQVTMTYIRAWMSSKFCQIRSGTTELAALEHRKNRCCPFFLVSQLCLYLGNNSQVSVYRTIGPLVKIFEALFKTFELHKDDIKDHILREVFQSKMICKKTVSKGWCKESSCVFVIIMGYFFFYFWS